MLRDRARRVSFTHPVAAAIVPVVAWLFVWRAGAIGVPELDAELRLVPLAGRLDARVALVAAPLAALAAVVAPPAIGRWLRRGLGIAALGVLASAAYALARYGGAPWRCPFLLVDAAAVAVAGALLLAFAGQEPGPGTRWLGVGAVVVLAAVSAAWTYRATRPLERYAGGALADLHVVGYFATSQPFTPGELPASEAPPAVPRLPMQGSTMLCGGDWRVVAFADRPRCLPHRPLVALDGTSDVLAVELVRATVGARPGILVTLRPEAADRLRAAMRAARSFRLVLVHQSGDLVFDAPVWDEVEGTGFLFDPGPVAGEPDRTLRALLGD